MALTGQFRELAKLKKRLAALGTPGSDEERKLLARVRLELKPEVQKMYRTSAGPTGAPWVPRKDGKPAYRSKKMENAIKIARVPGGLLVVWLIGWLEAADRGHTFAARVGGGHQMFFDRRGRAIKLGHRSSSGKFVLTKRMFRISFVQAVTIGMHRVGTRRLPERQQKPRGALPQSWASAMKRGLLAGLDDLERFATR